MNQVYVSSWVDIRNELLLKRDLLTYNSGNGLFGFGKAGPLGQDALLPCDEEVS